MPKKSEKIKVLPRHIVELVASREGVLVAEKPPFSTTVVVYAERD